MAQTSFTDTTGAMPVQMLRWVFRRGGRAVTCEIDARDDRGYEVAVIPHWDVSGAQVEQFDDALGAMERHASIARSLRAGGWVVIDHAVPRYVGYAA